MQVNDLKYLENARLSVASRVRSLRAERGWTQKQLAEKLDLSQNRLSEVERGNGSFTAEQLLLLAQLFNVPIREFAPRSRAEAPAHAELQNALARLGAPHLNERDDVLPSERLERATRAIKEALVIGDPRLVVALAPVVIRAIDRVSLPHLWLELREIGLERRLGWLAENVLEALRTQRGRAASREVAVQVLRAKTILEFWVDDARARYDATQTGEDLLDATIRSAKTLEHVLATRSEISRRWRIATTLQPADFAAAMEAARAGT
ncbi:MAG: helix-turn-helix domain-containing protein [Deltaproteobacteria bacterium]|nr:helix-turn-helix domain-containing protein [Deltaproteobacteria bacterium]